jgi:hypothetical protein
LIEVDRRRLRAVYAAEVERELAIDEHEHVVIAREVSRRVRVRGCQMTTA